MRNREKEKDYRKRFLKGKDLFQSLKRSPTEIEILEKVKEISSQVFVKIKVLEEDIASHKLLLRCPAYPYLEWVLTTNKKVKSNSMLLSYAEVVDKFGITLEELELKIRKIAINRLKKTLRENKNLINIQKTKEKAWKTSKLYKKTYPVRHKAKTREDLKKFKNDPEKLEKYSNKQDPNQENHWEW